ncbi:DUF4114 domain-containing protein [Phormidium pseudopriestleyi FRX01]|uniref:DUF4114 domain-containing protein n=1 Tax=Phormidium pseudopriestleyi FRX01 TaxID=1759528 RepID=A0ABS3FK92_9CYAN|nr:DUF4114 domain-containing protein [Phormidium pseudopriestleyi]MBO0347539.1 DUF4114 domain-containing protein [Phormidium pseudopriestleyi FRX01]
MNAQISNNISSLKTISRQCTLGLMALVATTASVFTAQDASAQVTQTNYDAQYNASSDLLRLDFDTWNMFNTVVNTERQQLTTLNRPQADLSKLRWSGGVQDAEVFFINEGAGYRNQLFYSVDGGTNKNMIFGDISSPLSILPNSSGPMKLGQGASLGNFTGNTFIDFFVKSNGANGGQNFLGFDPAQNPGSSRGLSHVIGYTFGDYLLLGFEDIIGGGDLDFNDVVFAVKGVTTSVPEPSLMIGLIATGAMVMLRKRHQNSEV